MFGTEIPDGLIFGVLPVVLAMVVGLIAWIVREQGKSAIDRAVMNERIERLEEAEARRRGR